MTRALAADKHFVLFRNQSGLGPVLGTNFDSIPKPFVQMLEMPPGGVLLAESATAPLEMWALCTSGNVLAVQASPARASSDAIHGVCWQPWPPEPAGHCRSRYALQGHAELSAEETLEKIHSAVTAAGRLSAGAPCAALQWHIPHPRFDISMGLTSWRPLPHCCLPCLPAEEAEESARSLQEDPTDAQLTLQLYRRFMERGLPEVAAVSGSGAASTGDGAAAGGTAGTAEAEAEGAAASGGSGPGPTAAATPSMAVRDAAAAELLKQLQLAVGAELGKGLGELQLLQQCNEAAAERYQQLGDATAAARQRLQELHQQQEEELAPQLRLLDELEGQASFACASQHDGFPSPSDVQRKGARLQCLQLRPASL